MIYKKQDKRNKAFIGAIIGAVGSIASGVANGIASKKQSAAQEESYRQQAIAEANSLKQQKEIIEENNRKRQQIADNTYKAQMSAALTNNFNNLDYDNYNNKFMYKCGGKKKINRKKYLDGGSIGNIIGGIGSTSGGLINSIISNKSQTNLQNAQTKYSHMNDDLKNELYAAQNYIVDEKIAPNFVQSKEIKTKNPIINNNPFDTSNTYNDRLDMAKFGKRKRSNRCK